MIQFSDSSIAIACENDIVPIVQLLNSAYRGESSKEGWTTEANIIAGDRRTDEIDLLQLMQQPDCVFLKYIYEGEIGGCVNLQRHGKRIYLGMLSVAPKIQGSGLGKKILKASEEYAKYAACNAIYMSVISVRSELIDWYKRHGYIDTGERKPFIEDALTGKHLQPLEFMILEKSIL